MNEAQVIQLRVAGMLKEAANMLSPQQRQSTETGQQSSTSLNTSSIFRQQAARNPDRQTEDESRTFIAPSDGINNLSSNSVSSNSRVNFARGLGRGSVLRELRDDFAPYPRPSRSGARNTVVTTRMWSHRFFCLSSPRDTTTPRTAVKQLLIENKLGLCVIEMETSGTSSQVEWSIREKFPKLGSLNFELLRSLGGSDGKPLVRCDPQVAIPSASALKLAVKGAIVYIRPVDGEIYLEDLDEERNDEINNFENTEEVVVTPPDSPFDILNDSRDITSPIRETNFLLPTTSAVFETAAPQTLVQEMPSTSGYNNMTQDFTQTLKDLKAKILLENPGIQPIILVRDSFCDQVLGVYKSRTFNLYKEPHVLFMGEAGRDVGAVQKEFFWLGMKGLLDGKYGGRLPLFEGDVNHKLPTVDLTLTANGIFEVVAKFIVHSSVHCSVGFIGLSPAVIQYLTLPFVDENVPIAIEVDDIPYLDAREIITAVNNISNDIELDQEQKLKLESAASEVGFNEKITKHNSLFLREHLLRYYVIDKRKKPLEQMRKIFHSSPIGSFLLTHRHEITSIFPRIEDLSCPIEILIGQIQFDGEGERIKENIIKFIREECKDRTSQRFPDTPHNFFWLGQDGEFYLQRLSE